MLIFGTISQKTYHFIPKKINRPILLYYHTSFVLFFKIKIITLHSDKAVGITLLHKSILPRFARTTI